MNIMADKMVNDAPEVCNMDPIDITDLRVREDILQKAQELSDLISTSTEVNYYQKAEKQIQTNENVQTLIKAIKKKQKEIVAFESFANKAMVEKIEEEIAVLQNELDSIPIVSQFQQSQTDLNYLLQLIMAAIRDKVSEKIAVEAGKVTEESDCSD